MNSSVAPGIPLPPTPITKLMETATAAGCTLRTYPIEGHAHVTTAATYKTNPPTSGNHSPIPTPDGIYDPPSSPAKENYVHTLEHGRVEYQYRPGTPADEVKQLEALWNEAVMGIRGYKQLLFQNNTAMPFAVAATAWAHLIGCPTFNPNVIDALRDFRNAYVDKGPEQIPPN